jgi:hypothetical protein
MSKAPSATASPDPLPPGLALYQLGVGHYLSRALDLVARLGVADLLADGPRDATELAQALDLHVPSLRRVLRLLASVGVFEEKEDGGFALSPMGELLRSDAPDSMRSAVQLFAGPGIQDSWNELEFCVRTGQPAFRRDSPDADAFTHMNEDPAQAALFDEAMAAFTKQTALVVAAMFDFSRFRVLMDVGGGNGALILGILNAFPELEGIVFEQPGAAERAEKQIALAGLSERCRAIAGSFFDEIPPGADACLLKHVIHDWDDERATEILQRCRAALPTDGTLLLVEGVYPERIEGTLECRGAAANDVNMLVVSGGRQRSEAEFRELLSGAGFRLAKIVPTPARVCILETVPA